MIKTISTILLAVVLVAGGLSCQSGNTQTVTVGGYGNQVGNMAYDFAVPDLNGQTVTLSQYVGRPVLISFWSTG